ncbi:4Fe-4S dicluster domain-containing protein, partial [bacterium]|nr:4Fe-4S dicluster domain-containing protein [bacterium]
WAAADAEIAELLKQAAGQIVLLTGTIHGPARKRVIEDFKRAFPGTRHIMYDAWTHEVSRNMQQKCYGRKVLPAYQVDKAEYLLCFESDPLGSGYSATEWQVGFGKNRKVRDGKLNKLVVFDANVTFTGASADERFRIQPHAGFEIAMAIANELAMAGHSECGGAMEIADSTRTYAARSVEGKEGLPEGTIARIAQELWRHRGESIVFGGESESLQIAVNLLNSMLGNEGKTIDGTAAPSNQSQGNLNDILTLIEEMDAGQVKVLIVWGTNPVYSLPREAQFAEMLEKVPTVISFGDRADETSILGNYILPTVHWLENWGDSEVQKGLFGLTQPSIYPLHDCRASEESLIKFAQAAETGDLGKFQGGWHEFLTDTWQRDIYGLDKYDAPFDYFWTSALRDGVLDRRNVETTAREFSLNALTDIKPPKRVGNGLKLVVVPSPLLKEDGNTNNAWLLETPDTVSRIAWTNYASLSPKTATELKLKEGDIVIVKANERRNTLPVHIQPGDADEVVTIQSGWGRKHVGRVGDGLGANAFLLCGVTKQGAKTRGIDCTLEATGEWEEMPCTQGHNYLEGRPIVQDASFDEYLKDPHAGAHHKHELMSMWDKHEYPGNKWGMSIDLTSCTGCNACISACSVENNIPVVGKSQIQLGREMHWIRIDRYYSGEESDPEFVHQPMLCQHCENAPCETVCPVLATVHSDEGLNLQVYNRCVGTRYCANNCPYKVRRFNFHEYTFAAYEPSPLQLVLNPDVTVREKGVMEKCSFCQQRIREGKERAKEMGREVRDSDFQTACQQSCPTNAIHFGNMNNPESQVSLDMKDPRAFTVLQELNTLPSITYWTKLRNRAPRPWDSKSHQGNGQHEAATGGHHS